MTQKRRQTKQEARRRTNATRVERRATWKEWKRQEALRRAGEAAQELRAVVVQLRAGAREADWYVMQFPGQPRKAAWYAGEAAALRRAADDVEAIVGQDSSIKRLRRAGEAAVDRAAAEELREMRGGRYCHCSLAECAGCVKCGGRP